MLNFNDSLFISPLLHVPMFAITCGWIGVPICVSIGIKDPYIKICGLESHSTLAAMFRCAPSLLLAVALREIHW